ncbi:MAG TPA: hypothetical protein VGN97_01265 [Mesorhizobium sp.]|jgi:hypothetical protein|nr:hypothetical protein [Mesorhizobium sp.]
MRPALAALLIMMASPALAQEELPAGKYEPYFTGWDGSLTYWLAGDIIIEDESRYSFQNEAGQYSVDEGTKRITFEGGALDGAYALVKQSSGEPAIVIPHKENEELGKEFAISDIWAYRRK